MADDGRTQDQDRGGLRRLGGAEEFGKDAPGPAGGEAGGDDEIVVGGLAAVKADGGDFGFERGFVCQIGLDAN